MKDKNNKLLRHGDRVRFRNGVAKTISYFTDTEIAVHDQDFPDHDIFVKPNQIELIVQDKDKIAYGRFGADLLWQLTDDLPYDFQEYIKAVYMLTDNRDISTLSEDILDAWYYLTSIQNSVSDGLVVTSKVHRNDDALSEYFRIAVRLNSPFEMKKAIAITQIFLDPSKAGDVLSNLVEEYGD